MGQVQAIGAQKAPTGRNLILLRAGDASLHGSWSGEPLRSRNWDLHISYYGAAGAPSPLAGEGISWSYDLSPSKWSGIAQAIGRGQFSLDDYDYIALPDDDLIFSRGALTRAFETARRYNLDACQLSLLHDSFYVWPDTLHRPFLTLRYVSAIELMAPIIKMDVFKQMLPYLELEGNLWGMDHIVAHLLFHKPKSMAVIDAATVLHTRAFCTGPLYEPMRQAKRTPQDIEKAFLEAHNIPRAQRLNYGAVTAWGTFVEDIDGLKPFLTWPNFLKRHRQRTGLQAIAHVKDGEVRLVRPCWGTPPLAVKKPYPPPQLKSARYVSRALAKLSRAPAKLVYLLSRSGLAGQRPAP